MLASAHALAGFLAAHPPIGAPPAHLSKKPKAPMAACKYVPYILELVENAAFMFSGAKGAVSASVLPHNNAAHFTQGGLLPRTPPSHPDPICCQRQCQGLRAVYPSRGGGLRRGQRDPKPEVCARPRTGPGQRVRSLLCYVVRLDFGALPGTPEGLQPLFIFGTSITRSRFCKPLG